MTRPCYLIDFGGRFHFDVPPEELWSAIEQLDQFEQWMGWLGSFRVQGGGLHEGSVLRGTVTPPLPYRMSVQVKLTRCDPGQLIDATVSGDLMGDAHLRMRPDASGTAVDMAWKVEMMQRPMRWAARVAYPLLRWGHDLVVEMTVDSFRSQLERKAS